MNWDANVSTLYFILKCQKFEENQGEVMCKTNKYSNLSEGDYSIQNFRYSELKAHTVKEVKVGEEFIIAMRG